MSSQQTATSQAVDEVSRPPRDLETRTPASQPWIRVKLSILWFLQQFALGAWLVTVGTYMVRRFSATGTEISTVYVSLSIGAIVASVFVGYLADRVFSPRSTYIVLHTCSAATMFFAGATTSLPLFIGICALYMMLYTPTIPLATSIAFGFLTDPGKQFPSIRAWGTVGWIAGGLLIGWLGWEQRHILEWTFVLAGLASTLLVVVSLLLLPVSKSSSGEAGKRSIRAALGLDAFRLLKAKGYRVFFIASVLISVPASFFNGFTNLWLNEAGVQGAAGVQTLAQASEVLFLALMPFILGRYRVKTVMLVAMLAWVVRFALFAYADAGTSYWMVILGLVLHGVCFDFFFVTGQIYTDRHAPKSLRTSAQSLIFTGTYGLGFLIGSWISGPVIDVFRIGGGHNWLFIWLVPCAVAVATAAYFLLAFRDDHQSRDDSILVSSNK